MGRCHFTNACIYPMNGNLYCHVHQAMIDEYIRQTKNAAVEMPTSLPEKLTEEKLLDPRRETRQMAMRRLYRSGWPRKRIEQVFDASEDEVLKILGDILKPEHKPYSWWAT